LASEATIFIVLEDVNDEIPLFTEREQERVLEGEPIGTIVTRVNAIDKDGTFPNNQVCSFILLGLLILNTLESQYPNGSDSETPSPINPNVDGSYRIQIPKDPSSDPLSKQILSELAWIPRPLSLCRYPPPPVYQVFHGFYLFMVVWF
jgi:hypothetical protein